MAYAFINPRPTAIATALPAEVPVPAPSTESLSPMATASAVIPRTKAIAWVRMAPDILRAMAMAANHANRSAGEVWAEAAREWLLRKSLDADYDVLSYAPIKKREDGMLEEKHKRLWGSIDAAMSAIRESAAVVE
jgi:hypothetical protein